jgi:hypothetical protein
MMFTDGNGNLTKDAYDFLFAMFQRVGGSLESLNAATLQAHTWEEPGSIGATTPTSGKFTTLDTSNAVTMSGTNPVRLLITGAGYIEIHSANNPGMINNMRVGNDYPQTGVFTDLSSTEKFGCNGATPKAAAYVDPLAIDSVKVADMYAALVANGILTDTP